MFRDSGDGGGEPLAGSKTRSCGKEIDSADMDPGRRFLGARARCVC